MNTTRYQKSIRVAHIASKGGPRTLKKGSNNAKLGFKITRTRWKGKRLYSLTLTERETCPRSCHHWDDCYGNNMPFAHRFSTEGLMPVLEDDIASLLKQHKDGIVIRLHVLGDFYSGEYIQFWWRMLTTHRKLCIFGYTGHEEDSFLGQQIARLNWYKARCVIRFSRSKESNKLHRYAAEEGFEGKHFVCPEQTGKIASCADCGLCWEAPNTVKFLSH